MVKEVNLSARHLLSETIQTIKEARQDLALYVLASIAINAASSFYGNGDFWPLNVVTAIASVAIFNAMLWFLDKKEGQLPVNFEQSFRESLPRFVITVLVAMVVFLVVAIGLVALIVPGLIAMVLFSQAVYFALLRQQGVRESLKQSMAITKGHRRQLFMLLGGAMLVYLVVVTLVSTYTPAAVVFGALAGLVLNIFHYRIWRELSN